MIDDSLKSHPAQLSETDANFLASLLMGEPEPSPVLDIAKNGDFVLDLRDSNPTLTFDPKTGMAEMLGGNDKARVSDLVDVGAVLAAKPSAAVIARSVFGQPEPSALAIVPQTVRPANETEPSHGTSHGWFRPVTPVAPATPVAPVAAVAATAATAAGADLFTPKPKPAPSVTVRLDTATKKAANGDEVVFSAAAAVADRRRRFMLVALFLGALAIGGGLVALIVDNSLLSGSTNQPDPAAEIVTTLAPTTVAPTTAAPTTAVPTTALPTTAVPTTLPPATVAPTTAAPTTTVPPTTQAPATTAAPTTRAPRTTSRPATTRPPATSPPTTSAPTVTFAPPTWAEPLD